MEGIPSTFQDPAVPLIALPAIFTSQRVNIGINIGDDGFAELASLEGPGCIRHIWILQGDEMTLEISVDDADQPQVLAPIESLFGIMQDRDPYFVDCCAFTVLPNPVSKEKYGGPGTPGYNLFLPIPFSSACRIRVHGPTGDPVGVMVDWHQYDADVQLTPYRFHTAWRRYETTPDRGSYIEMANLSGAGFIAGYVTGYIQKNHADMVFHTGGTTMLLDGETNPHVIRGCNVEDDYGFTWGFNDYQAHWIGCPQHDNRAENDQDGVFYRFFGPDPIAFRSSLAFRAGCRGDDMETVVYYYKVPGSDAPDIETPSKWQVVGVFPGAADFETFEQAEFIEQLGPGEWPEELQHGDTAFVVHELQSDHGWIDLQNLFFTRAHTATPITVADHSAYARTTIDSDKAEAISLRVAVDAWCRIWLNGEHIATFRHDRGLDTAQLSVTLQKGANELLVKTNHFPASRRHRGPDRHSGLWVINCIIEREA